MFDPLAQQGMMPGSEKSCLKLTAGCPEKGPSAHSGLSPASSIISEPSHTFTYMESDLF